MSGTYFAEELEREIDDGQQPDYGEHDQKPRRTPAAATVTVGAARGAVDAMAAPAREHEAQSKHTKNDAKDEESDEPPVEKFLPGPRRLRGLVIGGLGDLGVDRRARVARWQASVAHPQRQL